MYRTTMTLIGKICSDCKKDLPLENFYRNKSFKCGYDNLCKKCRDKRARAYHASHHDVIVKRANDWNNNNRERFREIHRKYDKKRYHENIELFRLKHREYYHKNIERLREKNRIYRYKKYHENPEPIRQKARERYARLRAEKLGG